MYSSLKLISDHNKGERKKQNTRRNNKTFVNANIIAVAERWLSSVYGNVNSWGIGEYEYTSPKTIGENEMKKKQRDLAKEQPIENLMGDEKESKTKANESNAMLCILLLQ